MTKGSWALGSILAASLALLIGSSLLANPAFSDNLVSNSGTVKFFAGGSGSTNIKIVSNTASAEQGDPESGCNASTASPATVTLLSQPAGLSYDPIPPFTKCEEKTVTFRSNTPGTYDVTATISDSGPGVYHLEPFGTIKVIVQAASITIDTVTPANKIWGSPISFSGKTVGASGSDFAELIWGDGTTTSNIAISGGGLWGPVVHTYATPGTYNVVAYLKDGSLVKAQSAPFALTVGKHLTSLSASVPSEITGNTTFTVAGTLRDLSANNVGVSGRTITFDGTGAVPSLQAVNTQGVTFTGNIEIKSCKVSNSGPCSVDNIGTDPTPAENKVVHLGVGGKISFPEDISEAKLFLQNMGSTSFKYTVEEYTGFQDCVDPADGQNCPTSASAYPLVAFIDTVSGYVTIGGVTNFNGIKEITITEVAGDTTKGSVGIAAVLTMNSNGKPSELQQINFEDQAIGVKPSPFVVDGGFYSSIGIAQAEEEDGLGLRGHFAGDALYGPSDSNALSYDVQSNLGNLAGIGGESVTGDGVSITKYDCSTIGSSDADKDGICSTWESTGIVTIPTGTYVLPEAPAGDAIPDVYFEIDAMSGYAPTQTEINTIKNIFNVKGIRLHVQLDETGLTVKNPFHVWTDTDTNADNDYVSVKNNHFGTVAERDKAAGVVGDSIFGTLGQGADLLEAKLHVVRYTVFVQNINSGTNTACGTSGMAELQGNDAVVGLGCGFGTNPSEERKGTLMHEWGHNLGLRHGGSDDENCKPNQKSVMNYAGQVPWSLLPKPTAGQTTNVGWYLGYSSEALSSLTESNLNDGFALNITPTKWKAPDGTNTNIQSFKFVWGTPLLATKVQTGTTGTPINWDKDANSAETGQQIDLNYMSLTIGAAQIPACTPANSAKTTIVSTDEWATIKTKLNFRSLGTLDGLGFSTHTDPDQPNEPTDEFYDALNLLGQFQFSGVKTPLKNVDLGEGTVYTTNQGNSVSVQFNIKDGAGNEITDANSLSVYHIKNFTLKVAEVDGTTRPLGADYLPPETSTQGDFRDYFTWDGSKWGFQFGTKNLDEGATYAARIYLELESGAKIVLDSGADQISFLFKLT